MSNIYEQRGGEPAVQAAVTEFYRRILADAELAPLFAGADLGRLARHQRAFLTAALDGPHAYAGRDTAAAQLAITDAQFDAVVGHLVDTLAALGVADATIATIGAALAPLRGQIVTAPARVG